MNATRRRMLGTGMLGLSLTAVWPAGAQSDYPSRPIRLIVAFSAGSASDTVGRAIADELSKQIGVPVVIENREGAGGNLGHAAAAKAAPDGYTLLMGTSLMTMSVHMASPALYDPVKDQVCSFAELTEEELESVLAATPVNEVWGVGRRITAQLNEGGIITALDLARMDTATIRCKWSVVLERTVRELQGTACIDLDDAPTAKKEIACTRSFGHPVTELSDLNEAVTHFASRAAEKRARRTPRSRRAGESS